MILAITGAMVLSFILGMFTVSMVKVGNEYSAFRAGYVAATDEDIPPHMLESEIMAAYKRTLDPERQS